MKYYYYYSNMSISRGSRIICIILLLLLIITTSIITTIITYKMLNDNTTNTISVLYTTTTTTINNTTTGTTTTINSGSSMPLFDTVSSQQQQQQQKLSIYSRIWTMNKSYHLFFNSSNSSSSLTTGSTNNNTTNGIYFIKVPKSASSTITGIIMNIQHYYSHYSNSSATTSNTNSTTTNTNYDKPFIQWEHGKARDILQYNTNTNFQSNFVVTSIRLPHKRALSSVYYYQVSFHNRKNKNNNQNQQKQQTQTLLKKYPKDNYIIKQLQTAIPNNFIVDYLYYNINGNSTNDNDSIKFNSTISTNDITFDTTRTGKTNYHSFWNSPDNSTSTNYNIIKNIINLYDFIIIVEQYNECIVVLSFLWQIPLEYMITISSKHKGQRYHLQEKKRNKQKVQELQKDNNDDTNNNNSTKYYCLQLIEPIETDAIQQYFSPISSNTSYNHNKKQSKYVNTNSTGSSSFKSEWHSKHYLDYMLYESVVVSLNNTIQIIEEQLQEILYFNTSNKYNTDNYNKNTEWTSYIQQKLLRQQQQQKQGQDQYQNSSSSNNKVSSSLFQLLVIEYNNMIQYAQSKCILHDTTTNNNSSNYYYYYQPPCNIYTGQPQYTISQKSCHYRDFGCGHTCVVSVLQQRHNEHLQLQQQ